MVHDTRPQSTAAVASHLAVRAVLVLVADGDAGSFGRAAVAFSAPPLVGVLLSALCHSRNVQHVKRPFPAPRASINSLVHMYGSAWLLSQLSTGKKETDKHSYVYVNSTFFAAKLDHISM